MVVADDADVLTALERGLRLSGFDMSSAKNGDEALSFVRQASPDAVVVDINPRVLRGIDVVTALRAVDNSVPVCVLPERSSVDDEVPWLEAGARAQLWAAEQALRDRLTQAVLKQDAQDDTVGRQTVLASPPVDGAGAAGAAQKQALRRARVSLGLLQLGGAADLQALKDALERAEQAPENPEARRALCERLRQAWAALKPAP